MKVYVVVYEPNDYDLYPSVDSVWLSEKQAQEYVETKNKELWPESDEDRPWYNGSPYFEYQEFELRNEY